VPHASQPVHDVPKKARVTPVASLFAEQIAHHAHRAVEAAIARREQIAREDHGLAIAREVQIRLGDRTGEQRGERTDEIDAGLARSSCRSPTA